MGREGGEVGVEVGFVESRGGELWNNKCFVEF